MMRVIGGSFFVLQPFAWRHTRKKAARAWERRQERSRPLQAGQVVARRSPLKTSQVIAPANDEPRMRRPRADRACKQP